MVTGPDLLPQTLPEALALVRVTAEQMRRQHERLGEFPAIGYRACYPR